MQSKCIRNSEILEREENPDLGLILGTPTGPLALERNTRAVALIQFNILQSKIDNKELIYRLRGKLTWTRCIL